jgi:hypothetical protein
MNAINIVTMNAINIKPSIIWPLRQCMILLVYIVEDEVKEFLKSFLYIIDNDKSTKNLREVLGTIFESPIEAQDRPLNHVQ